MLLDRFTIIKGIIGILMLQNRTYESRKQRLFDGKRHTGNFPLL